MSKVTWTTWDGQKYLPFNGETPIRRVNVTPRRLNLYVGEEYQLQTKIEPSDATTGTVMWGAIDFDEVARIPIIEVKSERLMLNGGGTVYAQREGQARVFLKIFLDRGVATANNVCEVFIRNKTSDIPSSITADGFGGWYNPTSLNKGVNHRVPRFVQMRAGPCFGYCEMMGDHYLRYRNVDVHEFFNNRFRKSHRNENAYLEEGNNGNLDRALWVNTEDIPKNFSDFNELKVTLIEELDKGKPIITSRRTRRTDGRPDYNHAVLVVAYIGNGVREEDFIVIDPWHSYNLPMTYADFRRNFPNNTQELNYINRTRTFMIPERMI